MTRNMKLAMFIILLIVVLSLVQIGVVSGGMQGTEITFTACEISVDADAYIKSIGYTIDGKSVESVIVPKRGSVEICVPTFPATAHLGVVLYGTAEYNISANTVIVTNITSEHVTVKLSGENLPYTPSNTNGGSKEQSQILPSQSASSQDSVDVSAQYTNQNFVCIGASEADIAAIRSADPILAAELETNLARAEADGVRLTNNKGAPAIVTSDLENMGIEQITFSRIYDISSPDPNVKLTQVTVTVPKADIVASGLTTNDVTIYHYLAMYDLWVPLDTLQITEDAVNYYYIAATDGASPFGVLIKRFNDTSEVPVTTPIPVSPAPILGLIAGFGAAAVLLRLRK